MTTNHAPWRFCTQEEAMFRNRMSIFDFNIGMTDPVFTPRASCRSCQCRYCSRCTGGETSFSSTAAGKMPRGEQSVQRMDAGASSEKCDVGSRSVSGSDGSIERGDNGGSGEHGCGSSEQCTDGARSGLGTSSAAELDLHGSGGEHGSSNSGDGVRDSRSGTGKYVEPTEHRGDDVCDSGPIAKRGRYEGGRRDNQGARPVETENGASENVVSVLGRGCETVEAESAVSAEESEMGGETNALTIPNVDEWKCYLSFLQNKYGK